ncbi:hypothetical protein A2318_01830 [Candidatus Uhrbacteria bacterium RIFOXYB2_FULL_45_11]|uniref:Glutathione S-transferase n=1 Tax=Candidatus Uhrbacteria bacterium RIFOXYB2_FULL_45_11 TaxID=1802421 RepID=A0A1F7W4B2_9BACT|nr:MAG: hypothetical protein A2318_01830 [Candidatus Uhrbacteria bacterium RIFOXYB2_FULL_45_11]
MIKLYGPRGGSSLRAHWTLHELGVDYENIPLELSKGEHKQPEYLAINPAGQVPAIDVDGFFLAESIAIAQYLAEKYNPSLLGTQEQKAKGLQWALWIMLSVQVGGLSDMSRPKWTGIPDEAGVAAGRAQVEKNLPILETYLGANEYLAGNAFTVSDIDGVCTFAYARWAEFGLTNYPNISAWIERCEDRPAYKAAKGE